MRLTTEKGRKQFLFLISGLLLVYVLLAYFRGDISVVLQEASSKLKNKEREAYKDNEKNVAIAKRTETKYEEVKKEMKSRKVTILLWTTFFDDDSFMFGVDEKPFTGENRCAVDNCLVTNNRKLMNIEDFDAVVFHLWGNSILGGVLKPPKRNLNQYYVFASLGNSEYYPMIDVPPGFFNWTLTYRPDSDFQWPYYRIVDKKNSRNIVAPSEKPQWVDFSDKPVDKEKNVPTLKTKNKKVAWFVSRCETKNSRETYTKELEKYIDINIYGKCGPLKCERNDLNTDPCHKMLKDEYYFYLAFESADCHDYVSENALYPLQYDTIPIVYGGANYTRYLPPHSYINAKDYTPKQLAELMDKIMKNHTEYAQYFWWKEHYVFYNIGTPRLKAEPYLHPFCEMCEALQNPNLPGKQYGNIKDWWIGTEANPVCIQS